MFIVSGRDIFNSLEEDKNLKRKGTYEILKEELKKIKEIVDVNRPLEAPVKVDLQLYRTYPEEAKIKAIQLTEKLGVRKIAWKTRIPETIIRRWSKCGVNRQGKSGRKPSYPTIEEELFKVFQQSLKKRNSTR